MDKMTIDRHKEDTRKTKRTNLMTIFNVGTEDSWLKMSDTVLSFSKQMSNSEIGLQFVSKRSPESNVIVR
jgi:hypothetical protein